MKNNNWLILRIIIMVIFILPFQECFSQKQNKAEVLWRKGDDLITNNRTYGVLDPEIAKSALHYFKKALKKDRSYIDAYNSRGLAYYYMKKFDLAKQDFEKAISLDPYSEAAYTNRGMVYHELKKYSEAESDYRKVLQLNPKDDNANYDLGVLYDDQHKQLEAIKAYSDAIVLNPGEAKYYCNRGFSRMLAGIYEYAIQDLNKALQMDSLYKLAYINRGMTRYYLKQYQNAIDDFSTVLRISSSETFEKEYDTNIYSYNNIANCYHGLNKMEDACKYWQMALSKGYKYREEWKEMFKIDDPAELIKKYCK
jgi:tetratricopeptide (TPR) repeat protein